MVGTEPVVSDYQAYRQWAVQHKKCWVCANPECPYPSDEQFAAKAQEPGWLENKDCWMPFEEDLAGGETNEGTV